MSTPRVPDPAVDPSVPHEPRWNPDAHLERVYRRGRALRLRRRVGAWVGATLAAVVLVGAVVAVAGGGGSDRGQQVATAGFGKGPATTTSGVPGPGLGVGGAGDPGTTVSAAGPTATSTPAGSASASTTTVPKHRPTTNTTAAPATTTTVPATTTTAPCSFAYRTETDASSYSAGATVTFTLVVVNTSGQTCNGPSNAGISAFATVTDRPGNVVYKTTPIGIACTMTCTPPVLAPGGSAPYGAGEWTSAGAGSYQAVASRLGVSGSPASFMVH